jgi:hypothetical protein
MLLKTQVASAIAYFSQEPSKFRKLGGRCLESIAPSTWDEFHDDS